MALLQDRVLHTSICTSFPAGKSSSDWGNGPPHIAALEGKEPTKPERDVLVSLEREYEIAEHLKGHLA